MNTTLIFPCVNEQAFNYLNDAIDRNEQVICASSDESKFLKNDIYVHLLPTIHSDLFPIVFMNFVTEHNIKRLFCPVASVYIFMRNFIKDNHLDLTMIGESPIQQELNSYYALMERTEKTIALINKHCMHSDLNKLEVAAILKRTSQIYGESNDEKIAAMIAIFSDAPKGDVIEIGSLMGRSAFVLLSLSFKYSIGNVLTIDPWSISEGIQKDSPDLLTDMTNEWDHEALRESFYINLLPSRLSDHRHIRLSADEAISVYLTEDLKFDDENNDMFSGKISVIHIDGNHDYKQVKSDCDQWVPLIVSGGWLILDDYIWAHGDGPKRAGDELLIEMKSSIERYFECGKALFVKFK